MNILEMINSRDYFVILCFGDSITEANHCSEGHPGYVALLDEALRLACRKNKYLIINAGIGGAHAVGSVDFVKNLSARFKPDLTTIMYGMNDCTRGHQALPEFRSAISEMVRSLRSNSSEVVLLTQNPVDYSCNIDAIERRRCLPDYVEAVRGCAKEMQVELVDINAAWQEGVLDKNNNEHFKLMHDGVHPNNHGHRYIFEKMKSQITG